MTCFNPLNATSASLVFAKFKEVEFTTQSFVFPGIQAMYPKLQTPHMPLPLGPGAIKYQPLVLNFIIDANLENYMSIVKWLQAAPTTANKELLSDATVVLLSNKKNPIGRAVFKDIFPTSISSINFEYAIEDPLPIIATAEFDFTYYAFE